MDPTTQRIQSTQNATGSGPLDGYNAPFSSLDISDILCILYPLSDSARDEVQRMATANSPFVIHRIAANNLGTNLALKDDAMNVESTIEFQGNYALVLRLSNTLKVPAVGFSFGRNASKCDIVLAQDPLRRLSNVHFRIYVNEVGSVKIQDESTNGTYVDNMLLTAKAQTTAERQRTLISGTKIRLCLHKATHDIEFQVQIPRRDENYEFIYLSRVGKYIKQAVARDTAVVGNTSMFDKTSKAVFAKPTLRNAATSEWTGSGKYIKGPIIGKGAFAMVYKVASKHDGLIYAAKLIGNRHLIKNGILDRMIENETRIMQRLNHPNIIRCMESIDWNNQSLILIMEYVPGNHLGMLVRDDKVFSEDTAKTFSAQLLSAMGYLHTNGIIHGGIRPDNILIISLDPLEVKLTSLSLSRVGKYEQTVSTTPCSTLIYCAPEVYREFLEYDDNGRRSHGQKVRRAVDQRYRHVTDVWSLGVVLFYCMTGAAMQPIEDSISSTELFDRIMSTPLDTQPLKIQSISAQGVDFISRMLQLRPEQRATVSDLQAHVWLLNLDDHLRRSMDSGPDNDPDTVMEITDRPQPPEVSNSNMECEIPWPTTNTMLDFQSTPSLKQIEQFIKPLTPSLNSYVTISCQVHWQLLHVYKTELEIEADIGDFVTLTGTLSCAELNTLDRFTANMWDTSRMSQLIYRIVTIPSAIHDMSAFGSSKVIARMGNSDDPATSPFSSTAHFECLGLLSDVAVVLQQLAWFAAVFTLPTRDTLTISIPTLEIIGEGKFELRTRSVSSASLGQSGQFDSFNRLDTPQCWHGLLRGAVLAFGFPISHRRNGLGLELPFDLMLALADIRSQVDTGKNTILVGGSGKILLPISRLPGGMQWHCVSMNDKNDDASQSYDSIVAITEEDMEQFQTQRMFLGYYQHAQVLLGTRELVQSNSLHVMESGFLPPPRRIELADEGTITGGISVKSILSLGLSRKYVMTKTLRISLEGRGFHELVDEAEQQPAIVYDANTKCAWLVSELSVVLHIALSYLSNPKVQERRRTGCRQLQGEWPSLPYAAPRTDGGKESHRICKRPENCSLELWADGGRNKTFADVIEDTLKDFQSVRNGVAAQAKVTRRWAISRPGLRGWEYTEFLSRKTSFSEREVPRDGHYARWWELAKEKEKEMLVILVNGFGSLIRPTPFSKTMPGLVRIPPGSRLLVASQPCLSKMISLDGTAGPALGALNWGSVKEIHRSCNDHCDKASCFAIQILQLQSSLVKGDTRRPKDQVLYADAVIFGECEHYHKALFDAMLSNPSCLVKFTR